MPWQWLQKSCQTLEWDFCFLSDKERKNNSHRKVNGRSILFKEWDQNCDKAPQDFKCLWPADRTVSSFSSMPIHWTVHLWTWNCWWRIHPQTSKRTYAEMEGMQRERGPGCTEYFSNEKLLWKRKLKPWLVMRIIIDTTFQFEKK